MHRPSLYQPPLEHKQAEKYGDGPDTTLSPEEQQRQMDALATLDAEIRSRSIFDYPTAYLITEAAAVNDEVFSEAVIVGLTGAQVFYASEDLTAAHSTRPFDIVILHESMKDAVDREWAAQAFRDEVIFMTLNIPIYQLAEIVGNPCFEVPDQPIPDQWDWMNAFGYSIDLEDPQYYELVKETLLTECHSDVDTQGTMKSGGYRVTTMPLIKPEWIGTIPSILISYTHQYHKPNYRLGN